MSKFQRKRVSGKASGMCPLADTLPVSVGCSVSCFPAPAWGARGSLRSAPRTPCPSAVPCLSAPSWSRGTDARCCSLRRRGKGLRPCTPANLRCGSVRTPLARRKLAPSGCFCSVCCFVRPLHRVFSIQGGDGTRYLVRLVQGALIFVPTNYHGRETRNHRPRRTHGRDRTRSGRTSQEALHRLQRENNYDVVAVETRARDDATRFVQRGKEAAQGADNETLDGLVLRRLADHVDRRDHHQTGGALARKSWTVAPDDGPDLVCFSRQFTHASGSIFLGSQSLNVREEVLKHPRRAVRCCQGITFGARGFRARRFRAVTPCSYGKLWKAQASAAGSGETGTEHFAGGEENAHENVSGR